MQTVTYPSGAILTHTYDSSGQISQLDLTVDTPSGPFTETLASGISHAPFGPVTALTYGNGQVLTHGFDSAYRLDTQKVEKTAAPAVIALDRSLYTYDANGNRLSHSDALATPSLSSFGYDALNRLDTASGSFGSGVLSTRDYDYDANGNRTQLIADTTTTPATYEPNSNRLDTLGSDDVLLDANGNTLSNGTWSYSYTPHNRLKEATEAATLKASFAYNGLGQRITKTDESTGTTRHTLYGRTGERLAEVDSAGHVRLEYIYLDGQLLALYSPDVSKIGVREQFFLIFTKIGVREQFFLIFTVIDKISEA